MPTSSRSSSLTGCEVENALVLVGLSMLGRDHCLARLAVVVTESVYPTYRVLTYLYLLIPTYTHCTQARACVSNVHKDSHYTEMLPSRYASNSIANFHVAPKPSLSRPQS